MMDLATFADRHGSFYVPAYPLENVFDPTGAGDAFAGGFMAYLARTGSVAEDRRVPSGSRQPHRSGSEQRGSQRVFRG